jgi:hypothetical protein
MHIGCCTSASEAQILHPDDARDKKLFDRIIGCLEEAKRRPCRRKQDVIATLEQIKAYMHFEGTGDVIVFLSEMAAEEKDN